MNKNSVIFETERLIIRRFKKSDWQDLYEYLSDPEVVRFEPYDVHTAKQAKQEAENRVECDSFYAVCLKDSGKLIGNLYLQGSEFNTYELGYVLNRAYWGKGYATEGARALLGYAFKSLGARRIIATCSDKNDGSRKVLERLGMRREGHFLQNVYFKNDDQDRPLWFNSYQYAMLRDEWRQKNI